MEQIYNPYLPLYEYVPDGEPHVFDGRIYIYGSHDLAEGTKYCQGDYVTWSAPVDDLKSWKYEGVIYRKDQDPSNPDGSLELWAPDVTKGPDGRYYLYYCLAFYPEIGVAVSNSPAGPFEFYGHVKYPEHIMGGKTLNEHLPFDPAVLTDDDGRVYLYYGFSPVKEMTFPDPDKLKESGVPESELKMIRMLAGLSFSEGGMAVELEPDMVTMKEAPHMCLPGGKLTTGTGFEGHGFYEASSIRKINGKYYYVYSSQLSHELCYAVSSHPVDGYTYGGTIVSNGDIGLNGRTAPVCTLGNNHGGIVRVNDEWYIFYHRQTNGTEFSRQGCAEKIQIRPDGTIPQTEITSCGLNGGPLKAAGKYPASIACHLTSKTTMAEIDYSSPVMRTQTLITGKPCEDGSTAIPDDIQYISQIADGTVIGYKYFDFCAASALNLTMRGSAQGTLTVSLDEHGTVNAGTAKLNLNGSEWQNVLVPLNIPDGVHALYLIFSGDAALDLCQFGFISRT